MALIGRWVAEAERTGLASVGVFERLTYENLDLVTALAAAAATARQILAELTNGYRDLAD